MARDIIVDKSTYHPKLVSMWLLVIHPLMAYVTQYQSWVKSQRSHTKHVGSYNYLRQWRNHLQNTDLRKWVLGDEVTRLTPYHLRSLSLVSGRKLKFYINMVLHGQSYNICTKAVHNKAKRHERKAATNWPRSC